VEGKATLSKSVNGTSETGNSGTYYSQKLSETKEGSGRSERKEVFLSNIK